MFVIFIILGFISSCTDDIFEDSSFQNPNDDSYTDNVPKTIQNNEIWYVSYRGGKIDLVDASDFGAEVVSNEYSNGKGIITFDRDITRIGNLAFADCRDLYAVTIPSRVKQIGYGAFSHCPNLKSITIPKSVRDIESTAFINCDGLEGVYIEDIDAWCRIVFDDVYSNPLHYAGKLYLDRKPVTNVVWPEEVSKVGDFIFYNCDSLRSILIPDNVTAIGKFAFYDCNSLSEITMPSELTQLGEYAFYQCYNIRKGICIPYKVSEIGEYAFYNCRFTELLLEEGLITINLNAFWGCMNIENLVIPNSVKIICYSAFEKCSGLEYVHFGDNCQEIQGNAFCECTNLKTIEMGSQIKFLCDYAFAHCERLTTIYCLADTPPQKSWSAFYDSDAIERIYVPYNSVNTYKRIWQTYASKIYPYKNGAHQ